MRMLINTKYNLASPKYKTQIMPISIIIDIYY